LGLVDGPSFPLFQKFWDREENSIPVLQRNPVDEKRRKGGSLEVGILHVEVWSIFLKRIICSKKGFVRFFLYLLVY
jgi:hypothetical protein